MAQSSVEWLEAEFKKWAEGRTPTFKPIITSIPDWMIKEAKAMHEQEHENAFFEGAKFFREGQAWTEQGFREISHIVYSETFGKSEQ